MRSGDHHADLPKDLRFLIIITSDTIISKRSKGEGLQDVSGEVAASLIKGAGFTVVDKVYLPNDVRSIREEIRSAASKGSADVIIISGGTGLGSRDVTVEAVTPLLEKVLLGFGELFRRLSYESVGTSAIASRALAGVSNGVLLFALPGSPDAVRLALERVILPESPHLLKMARR
ncbi:MAG: molybdenum cofactor biosynthesis protein MoaB [Candidatus Verstraetearchaeota archaeon]|nr:molybdenum cofactor biosynthesis protein MoaB [Candidatus Verstraetearchaeota archaeon]